MSLEIWSTKFCAGYRDNHIFFHGIDTLTYFESCVTGISQNEDLSQNLIIDAGEDRTYIIPRSLYDTSVANEGSLDVLSALNLDSTQAAAGALLISVVTSDIGIANFDLTFLKIYSVWIVVEITAPTQVYGAKATAKIDTALSYSAADTAACLLPNSPLNEGVW